MSLAEFQFGPEAIEYIRGRLALGNTLSKLAQALQLSEGTIRAYLPSTVSSEQAKLTLELVDANSPALFRHEAGNYLYVVVPLVAKD